MLNVLKDGLDQPDLMGCLECKVLLDCLEFLLCRTRSKGHLDHQESLVTRDETVNPGLLDSQVDLERMQHHINARKEHPVHQENRVRLESLEYREHLVCQEVQENQVLREDRECLENQERLANLVKSEAVGFLDTMPSTAPAHHVPYSCLNLCEPTDIMVISWMLRYCSINRSKLICVCDMSTLRRNCHCK